MHCWYWISDLCEEHGIHFILGHALYMKAIHGGKTKNDRIDSFKIAMLMRGGNFPSAGKVYGTQGNKLGRAAYFMPKHKRVFDEQRFLKG